LHKELPEVRLYLAGRKMPDELKEAQIEGVEVVGEVADSAEFIASKQINVVPLLAGSGIRVKIIEAMELGKTVIATTTAADGIEYVDGEELLIADTPEQFVEQVRRCIAEPEMAKEIGEKAHRLVRTKYDNNVLTERMTEFYNKIIEKTLL
jgi:glycosyltransferase involved in cell wall biosynthesis